MRCPLNTRLIKFVTERKWQSLMMLVQDLVIPQADQIFASSYYVVHTALNEYVFNGEGDSYTFAGGSSSFFITYEWYYPE